MITKTLRSAVLLLGVVLYVVGVSGCGEDGIPCPVEPQTWTDLGIGLYVEEGAAEWALAPDLSERVDRIANAVANYAGHDPVEFRGWIVVFSAADLFTCGDTPNATGCARYSGWLEIARQSVCPEMSVLPHEFLHALGYRGHGDPLWDDWQQVVDDLNVQLGDDPDHCVALASMWYPPTVPPENARSQTRSAYR